MKREDLTGRVFGRLTVVSYSHTHKTPSGQSKASWLCQCECGNQLVVKSQPLKIGNTSSCGCLRNELTGNRSRTHGMTGTPTYETWRGMRERCERPDNHRYSSYGGRGIKVCDRWMNSFENFLADMGERPDGMTLDRIDVNGNYEPGNCKWATDAEQRMNKRNSIKRAA